MAASSKITAKFTTDTSGMSKGTAKIASDFNRLTKTSTKTQKALSRMTSGINFLVFDRLAQYALAAGRAFIGMANNALKTVDAIGKLSKSTGISTEGLQAFSLAASDAGVDQVALSGAFGRMSKRLAEAAKGFGEAKPALEQLGLSAANLVKLSPDEQFLRIGEAIGGLATEGEKAAIAFKIFSDQGLRLVPLFDDIRKKTSAAQEELSQLGVLLSKREISNVESLNDSLNRVQKTISGIIQKVVAELAPAVKLIADDWLGFVKESDGAFVTGIVDALKTAAIAAASWYDMIAAGINQVITFFQKPPEWVSDLLYVLKSTTTGAKNTAEGTAAIGGAGYGVFTELRAWAAGLDAQLGYGSQERVDYLKEEVGVIAAATAKLSEGANDWIYGSKKNNDLNDQASKKQISTADRLIKLFASLEEKVKSNPIFGPDVGTGVIDKFMAAASEASNTVAEQAKKNRISGLDARSSAGLNFLLQSGVAGKKPEEEIAKNTKKTNDLISRTNQLINAPLTVSIP
tara:strand:- start:314 stop:1864 length:1551 start_codon:yes stop_codon:yes gene_type:complete